MQFDVGDPVAPKFGGSLCDDFAIYFGDFLKFHINIFFCNNLPLDSLFSTLIGRPLTECPFKLVTASVAADSSSIWTNLKKKDKYENKTEHKQKICKKFLSETFIIWWVQVLGFK